MTITRQQVADLRAGDIVELTNARWPDGSCWRGPLQETHSRLYVAGMLVRDDDGSPRWDDDNTLTVVSRAPRLYVNHDRTEPATGDVVRDADDDGDTRTWSFCYDASLRTSWRGVGNVDWSKRAQLPDHLRLLVDGTTGLPPVEAAEAAEADPLASVQPGDPDPTGDGDCLKNFDGFSCTRPAGHTGNHIAGDGNTVCAVSS